MSFVTYDGELLRVRITHSGERRQKEVALLRSITGNEFLPGVSIWVLPALRENVNALKDNGFDLDPDVQKLLKKEGNDRSDFEIQVAERFRDCGKIDPVLFDCQDSQVKNLIYILEKNIVAVDASDTGTGKTYMALAIAKYLGLFPIIITAKSVIPAWYNVARKTYGIDCYVNNYDQFRNNNTPYLRIQTDKQIRKEKEITIHRFHWNLPRKCLLIFDEAHRCKASDTINGKMLASTKKAHARVLCLSATIADNPLQMYSLGLILGLFKHWFAFQIWAFDRGVSKGRFEPKFSNKAEDLQKVHDDIFPWRGSRLSTSVFGDLFPENRIICTPYYMENAKEIHALYKLIKDRNGKRIPVLTRIMRERQEIELLKVPTFIELAENDVEEGNSVVIFVNFQETIDLLSEKLKTKCIIDGRVVKEARQKNIEDFQSNKKRIILCNTAAGGVGIGLHDTMGGHPRTCLISPSYSAIDLIQVLGRCPRANAKTPVLQRLIYCAETQEEEIAEKVQLKVNNIKMINDGDLL